MWLPACSYAAVLLRAFWLLMTYASSVGASGCVSALMLFFVWSFASRVYVILAQAQARSSRKLEVHWM
jgi:hypothetical protein